jgi:hypothetical protein
MAGSAQRTTARKASSKSPLSSSDLSIDLMKKYTQVRRDGDYFVAVLKVDDQVFTVSPRQEYRTRALWYREMMGRALERLLEIEVADAK